MKVFRDLKERGLPQILMANDRPPGGPPFAAPTRTAPRRRRCARWHEVDDVEVRLPCPVFTKVCAPSGWK